MVALPNVGCFLRLATSPISPGRRESFHIRSMVCNGQKRMNALSNYNKRIVEIKNVIKLWQLGRLVILRKLHTNPSNFFWVDSKKFRRVRIGLSKHKWATISETICPEMLIFGK